MKKTFTQSMAWLHTWGGLLAGWLLFAVFLTGTLAVFDQEIDHWMHPEVRDTPVPTVEAAERGLAYLRQHHPEARAWTLNLPTERSPGLSVSAGERRHGGGVALDPATGEVLPQRDSAGGLFFFRFHFTLDLPRMLGIWVVGLLALGMLVALLTGIVIHKKFFKEFFTFRPGKGQRSWLDAHNATAVLLLPFHLMIAYTGLAIFLLIYMPAALESLFDGDVEAYFHAQSGTEEAHPPRGQTQPAPLAALAPMLAEAERQMGPVGGVVIRHPGRSDARVEVRRVLGNRIALTKGQNMVFDGVTGALLQAPPAMRASVLTHRVIMGLHFAQFGGYPMRWLYFLCGLGGCVMIATGLLLYEVKQRRQASPGMGARLVAALNLAAVAGLGVACVGVLWANRLLPLELAGRAQWEVRVFFLLWLACLVHAVWRPGARGWSEQLGCGAALCLGVPLLGWATGSGAGDFTRGMLEVTAVAIGLLLAGCAWRVQQPAAVRPVRVRRPKAEVQG